MQYLVTWEIDIEADSPLDAARLAKLLQDGQRDPYYTIRDSEGKTHSIDMAINGMLILGNRNYTLISRGAKCEGTLNPDEIFPHFEESLYAHESQEIFDFLQWMHDNKLTMGHGNYEQRFREYRDSKGAT